MTMKITTLGTLLALTICGCDGPVEKALDCAKLCDEADDCIGGDFDKAECRDQCVDDADQAKVDRCEQCLSDQDSCREGVQCTNECVGVLSDIVFK